MTLKEFFESLKELYSQHPELHDKQIVYAKDDEGNGFSKVLYTPSFGQYDGEDFNVSDDENEINAVCIN